jgi:hypothetical protein
MSAFPLAPRFGVRHYNLQLAAPRRGRFGVAGGMFFPHTFPPSFDSLSERLPMKTRFFLLSCLFAAFAFPAPGAELLFERFDGMTNGALPMAGGEAWTYTNEKGQAIKSGYYTSKTYSSNPPAVKLEEKRILSTPAFPVGSTGVTNVSFVSYNSSAGACNNAIQVDGLVGTNWVGIATLDPPETGIQTYSFPIPAENAQMNRLRFHFANFGETTALDDIKAEGPFRVTFDREYGFRFPEGTSNAITAQADYDFATDGTEFAYAWSGSMEGTDAVLAIPANQAPGTYLVTCTATVSGDEGTHTSNSIAFRVLAYHDITVTASEHGTVTASTNRAVEGTIVTLEATPESDAHELSSISVNGEKLPRGTMDFEMPDADATVTAVFKKKEDGDLIITFDESTSKNPSYASESFLSGCTSEGISVTNEFIALRCQGGDDGASGTDKSMRIQHAGGGGHITNGFFATADALEHPIARIRFDHKAYSATHVDKDWAVEVSTVGGTNDANWTTLATLKAPADWTECDVTNTLLEAATHFRIVSRNTKAASAMANFDNIHIWYGEAYRVGIRGVRYGARVVCDTAHPLELRAVGADGTEPYGYEWTVNGTEAGSGETCGFSEPGEYEVEVKCTDATGSNAFASVEFTLEKQYAVACSATGKGTIAASTNMAFAGDTVTLEAKPQAKSTLDAPVTATCGGEPVPIAVGGSVMEEGDWTYPYRMEGLSFAMPTGDVAVAATFRDVRSAAALPFEWHGPWKGTTNAIDGVTAKIGTDYADKSDYDREGNGAAKLDAVDSFYQIGFDDAPGELSYLIKGNSFTICDCTVFRVQESEDGTNWTDVASFAAEPDPEDPDKPDLTGGLYAVTNRLSSRSRHVRFAFKSKEDVDGKVGLDAIAITKGEGGESVAVKAVIADGGISFGDGTATLTVSLEGEGEFRAEDIEVWAATDLPAADWQPVPGATVEAVDDLYRVAVPILESGETSSAFISIGKPDFLENQP